MNHNHLSRREALARTGLLVAAGLATSVRGAVDVPDASTSKSKEPFRFCLNMATIRGQKLGIVKEVEVAAKAGYDALEPWIDSLQEFVDHGGSLKDLRQRLIDGGLTVESAIGFPEWLAEDEARRA